MAHLSVTGDDQHLVARDRILQVDDRVAVDVMKQ